MAPEPGTDAARATVRMVPTSHLAPAEVATLRALLWEAFASDADPFDETDWEHALGGMHFLLELDGRIVGHAAVVERELVVGGRPLRTGYVEAVATTPPMHGRGLGSVLMERVTAYVRDGFELGGLGTGRHHFYERLGWETWRGPSSVLEDDRSRPTPDDDGFILLLRTPLSPPLDVTAAISCHARPGAAW